MAALQGAVLFAGAVTLHAQDRPVTGVRISIKEDPRDTALVTIQNLRDQPLIAWKLAIDGAAGPASVISGGGGGLPPGESLTTPLEGLGPRAASVRVFLAVFADGYYEGHPAALQRYREQRAMDAADVRYWLKVLDNLPGGDDESLRTFLKDRLVERKRAEPVESIFGSLQMRDVILDERARTPGELRRRLAETRAAGVKRLARYEQPLTTSSTVPEGAVVSVALTSKPFARGSLFAVVENIGPAAIEAIRLDYYEPGGRRPSQSQLTQFNPELRGDSERGLIPSNGRREMRISWERYADGSLPRIDVGYVLFEDLSWQGSATDHAELRKSRERRADAADYWIATLNDLSAQPAEKAREHLAAKRSERAALDRSGASSYFAHHIERLIETARTSPGEFPAVVAETIVTLTRLRDHLSPDRGK